MDTMVTSLASTFCYQRLFQTSEVVSTDTALPHVQETEVGQSASRLRSSQLALVVSTAGVLRNLRNCFGVGHLMESAQAEWAPNLTSVACRYQLRISNPE